MQNNDNASKIQSYEFTGESLAESLSLEWGTLYKKMIRMGYNYGKDDLNNMRLFCKVWYDYVFVASESHHSLDSVKAAVGTPQLFYVIPQRCSHGLRLHRYKGLQSTFDKYFIS